MGRGRAKAKQVKVARQLKYNSGATDLDRLRAELGVVTDQQDAESQDAYAELGDRYAGEYDDEDTDDDGDPAGDGGPGAGPGHQDRGFAKLPLSDAKRLTTAAAVTCATVMPAYPQHLISGLRF